MAKKKIATGSVFQKAYKDRNGKLCHTRTWYLKYYVHGKPIEVASETEDYSEAVDMLRQKLATASRDAAYGAHPERVRMGQLFDLLLDFYRRHDRRSTYDVERKIEARLRPWWA